MNWKKEITSWAAILAFFAVLYFSGLLPVIQGAMQSVLLATGLMKPSIEVPELTDQNFDYRGQFTDFKGNTVNLQDYRGKTLFINLWASWCGPCRAEMPHISNLYDAVKGSPDLEFLMIGLDQNKQKSQEFMEGKNWTFPVVHASYGLNESLQSESIPTTLVVSKEGKIVFYQQGMSNFNTNEFKAFLLAQ